MTIFRFNSRILRLYLSIPLLFFSASGTANILLLDFNNNTSTNTEVESIANRTQEKLYIFPDKKITRIDKKTVKNIVTRISDTNITTVILSGHSSPSSFSGTNGQLTNQELTNAFKNAGINNKIQTLILRGCYTAKVNEILENQLWRSQLPNLSYIAGYDGRAWSSETDMSKAFIRDSLLLRDKFNTVNSESNFATVFQQIEHHDISAIAIWKKTTENEYYLSTNRLKSSKFVLDFKKIKNTCLLNNEVRKKYNKTVKKFDEGIDANFSYPPVDSNRGILRKIYEYNLNNQHCITLGYWQREYYDNSYRVASLLFYHKLIKNYLYQFSYDELKLLITQFNISNNTSYIVPKLESESRQKVKNFVSSISTMIYNSASNNLNSKTDDYTIERINHHLKALNEIIINFNQAVTPASWLTIENSLSKPFLR